MMKNIPNSNNTMKIESARFLPATGSTKKKRQTSDRSVKSTIIEIFSQFVYIFHCLVPSLVNKLQDYLVIYLLHNKEYIFRPPVTH
jgi:hypothetical protein